MTNRLTGVQELEWVRTGGVTCTRCQTRVHIAQPRMPLPLHNCERQSDRERAVHVNVPGKWRCGRAHVTETIPMTVSNDAIVRTFAGYNRMTDLEREICAMIVTATTDPVEGVSMEKLTRAIVARVLGPSDVTTKSGATAEDARRIARALEESMSKEPRD